MTILTSDGRVWAEKNAATSSVANVALYGDGWPVAFVDASRQVANEQGAQVRASNEQDTRGAHA